MAEIKNPTCPHCGEYLLYKTVRWYELASLDPTTWEYMIGAVQDEEDEPGIWCPSCYREINDEDFKQTEEEQTDTG